VAKTHVDLSDLSTDRLAHYIEMVRYNLDTADFVDPEESEWADGQAQSLYLLEAELRLREATPHG
jgi:hypothetical protein